MTQKDNTTSLPSDSPSKDDLDEDPIYACRLCYARGYYNCKAGGRFNINLEDCAQCSSVGPDVSLRASNNPKSKALVDGKFLCLSCFRFMKWGRCNPPGHFWDTSRDWPCCACGGWFSSKWHTSVVFTRKYALFYDNCFLNVSDERNYFSRACKKMETGKSVAAGTTIAEQNAEWVSRYENLRFPPPGGPQPHKRRWIPHYPRRNQPPRQRETSRQTPGKATKMWAAG